MDRIYMHALDVVKNTEREIEKICDNGDCNGLENSDANRTLQGLLDSLWATRGTLEYYTRRIVEGILKVNKAGRFELRYSSGEIVLTCGSRVEILVDGVYVSGTIEHCGFDRGNGYYLANKTVNNPLIHEAMRARARI